MPTCWLIDASPVARPCSASGSPDVAVTMKPTIATRLAMPPANVATSSSAIQPESGAEQRPADAVAAACATSPATIARPLPSAPITRGPSDAAEHGAGAEDRERHARRASGEKPSTCCR